MRNSSLAAFLFALVITTTGCPFLTSPDAGLKGKQFSGTYSGSKSGSWSCTMTDEYNCRGTWTVNGVGCDLAMGVTSGKTGGGSISCGTGAGSVVNTLSGTLLTGSWSGTFAVSGASGATSSYSGSLTGSRTDAASSGSTSVSLVGTWEMTAGGMPTNRQIFRSNGTGAARSWSVGTPRLDGVYVEYTYTATSTSYSTTATYFVQCDFNRGVWVTGPLPAVKNGTINVSNGGSTLTFDNKDVYTKSSGEITRETAGSSCSKF